MNVLAIGCHPDDLEIACFGTLSKFISEGHNVSTCHIANGNLGHAIIGAEELREIRTKEAENAAAVIGTTSVNIDEGDMHVDSHKKEIIERLTVLIRKVKPDLIITHNPDDYMQDHMETSHLAFNASFAASVAHYTDKEAPHPVCPIYYMDTLAGVNFVPTEYVDVTEHIELKLQGLACHKSQVDWMKEHDKIDFLDFVRTCSKARGLQCGVEYAEGFRPALYWGRMATKRLLP